MSNETFKRPTQPQAPAQAQAPAPARIQGSAGEKIEDLFSVEFGEEYFGPSQTPDNPPSDNVRAKTGPNDLSPVTEEWAPPGISYAEDFRYNLIPPNSTWETAEEEADTVPMQAVAPEIEGAGMGPNNSPARYERNTSEGNLDDLWDEFSSTRGAKEQAPAPAPAPAPFSEDYYRKPYTGEND